MEKFYSDRLFVRELVESDVTDIYLDWFSNEKVVWFLEVKNLTKESAIKHLNLGKDTGTYYMYAICDIKNDQHIGNMKIGPIDLKHNISDLVIVVGDTEYWGKGLGTEIIKLGNYVAFSKHNIRKLTGGMYEDNIGSIKAYTRAGWVEEGRLVGHYQLNGRVMDRVLVSYFNPKYFYQDEEKNWKIKS